VDRFQYEVLAGLAPTAGLGPGALGLDLAAAPGEVQVLDVDGHNTYDACRPLDLLGLT
jgi:hypothetical protein